MFYNHCVKCDKPLLLKMPSFGHINTSLRLLKERITHNVF